jgi:hypothetical protein
MTFTLPLPLQNDLDSHHNVFHNTIPNTRNIIQKWSVTHLHGVDLTSLDPPPLTSRYDRSNSTSLVVNEGLKKVMGFLRGDGMKSDEATQA